MNLQKNHSHRINLKKRAFKRRYLIINQINLKFQKKLKKRFFEISKKTAIPITIVCNRIKKLQGLGTLVNLRELDFEENSIEEIEGLDENIVDSENN